MSKPDELKVYRISFLSIAIGWVCAVVFFTIGVGITAMAAHSYPAMNALVGTLAIVFSLWLAAVVTTTRLIVTHAGLAYWGNLRRRFIGWSEVKSFRRRPVPYRGVHRGVVPVVGPGYLQERRLGAGHTPRFLHCEAPGPHRRGAGHLAASACAVRACQRRSDAGRAAQLPPVVLMGRREPPLPVAAIGPVAEQSRVDKSQVPASGSGCLGTAQSGLMTHERTNGAPACPRHTRKRQYGGNPDWLQGWAGRLDELSYGPKREFRPPSRRWLVIAGVAGLVAVGVTIGVTGTGGRRAGGPPPRASASAGSMLLPTGAPGPVPVGPVTILGHGSHVWIIWRTPPPTSSPVRWWSGS